MTPNTELAWISTTIDIAPTSMYGAAADRATIRSVGLPESILQDDDDAVAGDERVSLLPGGLIAIAETIDIENGDDRCSLSFTQPPSMFSLTKNAPFTLAVMLPATAAAPQGPIFDIELTRYTSEPAPTIFGVGAHPSVGGRIVVNWSGRMDPEFDVQYYYRRIRDGVA